MTSSYEERKTYYDSLLTLFGRKPVAEALASPDIEPVRLHLARSNRPSPDLDALAELTRKRGGDVKMHTRESLSRISRNRRQDQGVAIDVRANTWRPLSALAAPDAGARGLLAVDGITNPQNLGMIIRATGASTRDGLVLATRGNAPIDGLVVKASAGTLFKTPLYRCEMLPQALDQLHEWGYRILGLDGEGEIDLATLDGATTSTEKRVFVLGNETHGLSPAVRERCGDLVRIELANGIESLNVAVAAGIVAFAPMFARGSNST